MNNNQDNEIVVLIQDVIAGNAERSFVTGYIRKCTLLRIQYIRMKKRA